MAKSKREWLGIGHQGLEPKDPVKKYVDLYESQIVKSYKKDNEGKVYEDVEVKKVLVREKFADVKVADFSIENLQAIGADQALKHSVFQGDIDTSLNNIGRLMDQLDALDNVSLEEDNKNISE